MSTYYSIPVIINIAKATQPLAQIDISKQKSFKGGTAISQDLPILLYTERKSLEWVYTYRPSSVNLERIANYVYALCGNYVAEALAALGSGGGIVIDPTTGTPMGFEGYREDFIVGQAGALMVAGDSVLTINLPGFIRKTVRFEPSGVDLNIGWQGQNSINSIVYTPTSVVISLNFQVADGEGYIVEGLRAATTTSVPPSTGSGVPDQTGHAGEVLFTNGIMPYWGNVPKHITSADFEPDGKTIFIPDLGDNTFLVFFNDISRYLIEEDPLNEFTRIDVGGFVVNLAGFDASTNDYHLFIFSKGLNA